MKDPIPYVYNHFMRCLTTDLMTFNTRTTRRDYWLFILVCNIITLCAFLIYPDLTTVELFTAVLFLPLLSITVRRMNDVDHKILPILSKIPLKWRVLITILLLGTASFVLFVIALIPSDPDHNQYG